MKNLPYFKWYPADAEMDAKYRAMDDAERGFYLSCLNYAWINGGLPAEAGERARVLGRRRAEADKRWLRVGICFQPAEQNPALLVNPRQERERLGAISKSEQATKAVNSRRDRYNGRSTDVGTDVHTDDHLRALARADSVCVSDSFLDLNSKNRNKNRVAREPGAVSQSFAKFWARWCELTGRRQRESFACQAWISVVEFDTEAAAMACLESYGASDEVARGVVSNPDKWLYEQARDDFVGDWPPRNSKPANGIVGEMERYLDEH